MIENLGSSYLAKLMKESLSRRMNERRTDVSRLLQYLYKGNQGSAELNSESVLNFGSMNKTTIIAIIASLVKPSEDISSSESDTEIIAAEEVKSPLSLQEKLDRAITDEINAKITSKTRTLKDITSVVKKELINFEIEGKRGPNLKKAYNDLSTIPPASRSSLNDESLDMLSFLKSYFKSDNLNYIIKKMSLLYLYTHNTFYYSK
jgi:hypothetical protein